MENQNVSNYSMDKNSSGINKDGRTVPVKCIPASITNDQYEKKKLKTLIQQRVEFLFGADALVEEFRYPRKVCDYNENFASSNSSLSKSNKCDSTPMHQKANDLPVVRHLRPEFRSMLTLRAPVRCLSRDMENLSTHDTNLDKKSEDTSCSNTDHLKRSDLNAHSKIGSVKVDNADTVCSQNTIKAPKNTNDEADSIVALKINDNSCKTLPPPQSLNDCDSKLLSTLQLENHGRCHASKPNEDKLEAGVVAPAACHNQKSSRGFDKIQFSEMNDNKTGEKSSIVSKEQENESIAEEQNGQYFLSLLESKQARLLELSHHVDGELEALLACDVSEEIIGYLRSASGKARLLTSQKMEQFRELCIKNINQKPEEDFPVTNGDLQGFWDMIMLQVNHIESLFSEIETLRKNNWQQELTTNEAPVQDKVIPRSTLKTTRRLKQNDRLQSRPSSSSESKDKRQAQRKLLIELKRNHKIAVDDKRINSDQIEIFVDKVRKN